MQIVTSLAKRTTRLRFTTESEVRERGRYRKVQVEARPEYAIVSLCGLHTSFTIPWDSVLSLAVKQHVAAKRAEKKAKKEGK